MITVTYDNKEFNCHKAYKGRNYIRLVDEAGCVVANFEGVVDFSLFAISGGQWLDGSACPGTTQAFYSSKIIDFTKEQYEYLENDTGSYKFAIECPVPEEACILLDAGKQAFVIPVNPLTMIPMSMEEYTTIYKESYVFSKYLAQYFTGAFIVAKGYLEYACVFTFSRPLTGTFTLATGSVPVSYVVTCIA